MKVVRVEASDKFKPITITLTVESAEEAGQLFALHNHVDICQCTKAIDHEAITDSLGLQNGHQVEECHKRLCKLIK